MRIIVSIMFTILSISTYAQYSAEDAYLIDNGLIDKTNGTFAFKDDPTSVSTLCKTLRNYLPESERNNANLTEKDVLVKFKDNPFFDDEIQALLNSPKKLSLDGLAAVDKRSGMSLPNIDVTNFADGLAKFLVARTKEELNISFFRKFKEFIDSYPEVQTLFPNTYNFIGQIQAQNYASLLPALRTAFNKDFSALNSGLLKLRDLTVTNCNGDLNCTARITKLNSFFKSDKGRVVTACLLISDNLIAGNNAADIIANLTEDPLFTDLTDESDNNFSNMVYFVYLISQSLRSRENGMWIDSNNARRLVSNPIEFNLYLGLLYESDRIHVFNKHNVQFKLKKGGPLTLNKVLKDLGKNRDKFPVQFRSEFKKLADAAASVAARTRELNNTSEDGIEAYIIQYSQYTNTFSDFLKISFSFLEHNTAANQELGNLKDDISKFIEIVDASTGVAYDIKSKNYSALVLDSSILLSALLEDQWAYKDSFTRYATFMANITEAKSSDEVNHAIESAVLPAGSSSIKRESGVNISINAYLGAFYGWESMPALEEHKVASSAGLLAPVGVAFSLGNIKKKKCAVEHNLGGKSVTLFLSVIDVGALASYRFDENQTNIASDIKLENIISPGLFLYYGFGKCPISLGGGIQFSPQLRGISENAEANISDTEQLSIRYGFSVVVDIPLFNLFTKTGSVD